MKPGKTGIARLIAATGYSLKGIRASWQHETAFRQEVALILVLFPASFFVAKSTVQWLLLVSPLFLLLMMELLNSAASAQHSVVYTSVDYFDTFQYIAATPRSPASGNCFNHRVTKEVHRLM